MKYDKKSYYMETLGEHMKPIPVLCWTVDRLIKLIAWD